MGIIENIKISINELLLKDAYLLENDLSEMSITHKLAEYLQKLFPNYVDCEYNGNTANGKNGKKLISVLKTELKMIKQLQKREIADMEIEFAERQVFPDIIIHRRGSNENNLCIIEVKKSKSKISFDYDFIKLKAYTSTYYGNDLRYKIGIFIKLTTGISQFSYDLKTFMDGQETTIKI